MVVRRVRFVRCGCTGGCGKCGLNAHAAAAPGVLLEIVEEHTTKRWVPSMHLRVGDGTACGGAGADRLTTKISEVTCRTCLKRGKTGS